MNYPFDSKTLIVVYKDEMLLNLVKKLIETKAPGEEESPEIKIVSWTEKAWLAQKKEGNLDSKVLFLGDIKGTDKLIPVLDIKYCEHGVQYGWAGTQAVLFATPKEISKHDEYEAFMTELRTMQVPAVIKGNDKKKNTIEDQPQVEEVSEDVDISESEEKAPAEQKKGLLAKAKNFFDDSVDSVNRFGVNASLAAQDFFRDKKFVARQMLFFGAIKFCENGLDEFINS